jgi:hypothetical protein
MPPFILSIALYLGKCEVRERALVDVGEARWGFLWGGESVPTVSLVHPQAHILMRYNERGML